MRALSSGASSWYDFNLDGLTDQKDLPYITRGKFPRECQEAKRR